jgi:hypothetical protein
MRRIMLSSVACQSLPYFSTLSRKRHDFLENIVNVKFVFLISCTTLSTEIMKFFTYCDNLMNLDILIRIVHTLLIFIVPLWMWIEKCLDVFLTRKWDFLELSFKRIVALSIQWIIFYLFPVFYTEWMHCSTQNQYVSGEHKMYRSCHNY